MTDRPTPFAAARTLTRASIVIVATIAGCAAPGSTTFKKPVGSDQYVKAVDQIKTGDQDQAIAELEKAIVLNPSLTMAQMTLGELYIARKNYESAVPHLETATELDPYTLKNYYNLGLSLQMINHLQESSAAYIKGLKIDPDDFKSNMNLGLVYFSMNQLDAAAFYLEKATRIDPKNARAWTNVGVVYDARGNATFAEASYRKALELDPASESTLINLTCNLITQKKSADAIAIARQLVTVNPTPLSKKRLGDAFVAAEQWNDAAKTYDDAIATDARFLPAINAKAEMYATHYENDLRLDDSLRQQALATWNQSLKIVPEQAAVKANVAKYSDTKAFR